MTMESSQLVTIAISVGIPLLVLAFTFGRLSQKADGLKESVEQGFKLLYERENEQDKTLVLHHGRLVSLEEWRRLEEKR